MAFSSIFKTRSIVPKITRFSSSIFGSRRLTDSSKLSPTQTPLADTLLETNTILEDIQRQLAIDFAYRVVKEKEEISDIRKRTSSPKITTGQGTDNKLGSGIGKVFNTVTAPVKGVFSRILGFFGWLAAGFVVNKGIKWLSDNPEKLTKMFDFLGKHWKLITGLVIGGIIGRVVLDLVTTVSLFKATIGGFLRLIGIRGLSKTKGAKLPTTKSIGRTGLLKKIFDSGVTTTKTGLSRVKGFDHIALPGGSSRPIQQFSRTKSPLSKMIQGANVGAYKIRTKLGLPKSGIGLKGGLFSALMAGLEFKGRRDEGQGIAKATLGTGASTVAGIAGATKGATIGGGIGAMFGGAGAIPGAIIGSLIGGFGASWLAGNAMDAVSDTVGLGGNEQILNRHESLWHSGDNQSQPIVLDPINFADDSSGPPNISPSAGRENSTATISAEDFSNDNIWYMKDKLGIYE